VAAKRSYANYLLPYKATNWSRPRTSLINVAAFAAAAGDVANTADDAAEAAKLADMYQFSAGRIPPYRQMFYQYYDIQVGGLNIEIRLLIEKGPI
jgi:hypothetical protein